MSPLGNYPDRAYYCLTLRLSQPLSCANVVEQRFGPCYANGAALIVDPLIRRSSLDLLICFSIS
jgi:hypothetical protein